ncbi:ETS-related transcription factor Elf-3 [Osmerus mordax]|uniref:ETS-related transcription factor Elf-3 n=1 Tax=Osmerus mordax TaxID=8014 RepID=UPI00350FF213
MASSCDLSSVLTHANLTMYPSGSPDLLQQPGLALHPLPPCMEPMLMPHTPYSGLMSPWYEVHPQSWTKQHVLEWISFNVDACKLDSSTLSMSCCNMDGQALCQLTHGQLINTFGSLLGSVLLHSLQEHKSKYEHFTVTGTELSETCKLLDIFLDNFPEFPFLNSVTIGEAREDSPYCLDTSDTMAPRSDDGYDSEGLSSSSSSGGIFSSLHPSSPESRSSDSDPEFCYPAFAKHIKTEKCEVKKRGRGRPPKLTRDHFFDPTSKKSKHAPRGTHLWEFIRDILIHPEQNQGLMKWEDRRDGVFKFIKSEAVAQMWGQKKKNSSMTYEKLSRAMRYYYKREILERVDGRRLVYKFGKNSSGWKLEETQLGM